MIKGSARLLAWVLLSVLVSCGRAVGIPANTVADGGQTKDFDDPACRGYYPPAERDVDLLFVVDNSASTAEEQIALTAAFPALLRTLRAERFGPEPALNPKPCNATDNTGCSIPNLHVGVISTDLGAGSYGLPSCKVPLGDKGRLLNKPREVGCSPPAQPYIRYINGVTNIPGVKGDVIGAVAKAFSCVARLGVSGCGFEAPFEAARRALDPALKINPDFLRHDALLVLVFVTDEDDCSARKLELFDPAHQGLSDPLGPLTSFRCFEFGFRCDVNGRVILGRRSNCIPAGDWLHDVKTRYVDFFKALKRPGRVVVAGFGGPVEKVEVALDWDRPTLVASCHNNLKAAYPALRLKALTDAFGADGLFNGGKDNNGQDRTPLCSLNFQPAFETLGRMLLAKLHPGCPDRPRF